MKTDTPETDENTYHVSTFKHAPADAMLVNAELSRKLERERNELREKYRMHHDEAERITKMHSEIMKNVRLIERVANSSKSWGIRSIAREIISLENAIALAPPDDGTKNL